MPQTIHLVSNTTHAILDSRVVHESFDSSTPSLAATEAANLGGRILPEVRGNQAYDPATQKLAPVRETWVDTEADVVRVGRRAVDLSAEELAERAARAKAAEQAQADHVARIGQLRAVYGKLDTGSAPAAQAQKALAAVIAEIFPEVTETE